MVVSVSIENSNSILSLLLFFYSFSLSTMDFDFYSICSKCVRFDGSSGQFGNWISNTRTYTLCFEFSVRTFYTQCMPSSPSSSFEGHLTIAYEKRETKNQVIYGHAKNVIRIFLVLLLSFWAVLCRLKHFWMVSVSESRVLHYSFDNVRERIRRKLRKDW